MKAENIDKRRGILTWKTARLMLMCVMLENGNCSDTNCNDHPSYYYYTLRMTVT